tara:strand:+ start:322 stop:636 length:315 start_codon:yes stop_codon:yes gene_type:complete
MDKSMMKHHMSVVSEMAEFIEKTVAYAQVLEVNYDIDQEMDELICRMIFSRGNDEYEIGFNWMGIIDGYSKKIPKMLLVDAHNAICGYYVQWIIEEISRREDND